MDDVTLNWAEASVKDGQLSVSLEGELPSGWKPTFEKTVRLLGGGEWGEVELKRRVVRVNGIEPGVEDKVHHYLEGVVEQANAAHRRQEESDAEEGDADGGASGPDAEMTEHFRAFAGEPDEEREKS